MTTIATWNVNSIRTRLPHLLTWINERTPDIILLQELKCQHETFPHEALEDAGYNIALLGQKSYNGVAILSKFPLEDMTYNLPTFAQDSQARYIEAVTNGLRVASVYVPNGQEVGSDKFTYKLAFLKALKDHCRQRLSHDEVFVVGGDYNIAPGLADVPTPDVLIKDRILCSRQERQAFSAFLNDGLVDGFRLLYPDLIPSHQQLYSWWDYRAGSYQDNKGYRIDHLLCSPQGADRLEDGGIDHETRGEKQPSDHAPVWLRLA